MNLYKLNEPFKESEIEWRIGRSGKKGNGQVWAMCLAYVQARAIMNRLDEVCGPGFWKPEYRFIPASQGTEPGVIATISILVGDQWIAKEDGAEQTDIESFKGGLSSALKRAGVVWGIGRYLYGLEEGFAQIVPQGTKDGQWAKTKDGAEFYWIPPTLPQWALPQGETQKPTLPRIVPEAPPHNEGFPPSDDYKITFGKFNKRTLEEVGAADLRKYVEYLEGVVSKTGKPLSPIAIDFVERASSFIAAFENRGADGYA